MALELDMSKGYDRLEWSFVEKTLTAMGYPQNLVNLIIICISSVSYQILINGHPSTSFCPKRGLRQSDPLSPYHVIMCANVLSGMIHKCVEDKKIHGVKC